MKQNESFDIPSPGYREILEQMVANERMAELWKIAAGIIHELNTPLSVIASAAQLVLREEGISENCEEMVGRIHEEAQRLGRLTRGILSFSRGDEGVDDIDVNGSAREILALLRFEAGKRSVLVVEELEELLPLIRGNGDRLKQVLLNLMTNAIQAMGEGGVLTVRTVAGGGGIDVEIADTGCGIPGDRLERIFEPFYTTKLRGEGTGLGLYVTSVLVADMRGEISVTSTVGEGTSFLVHLPLQA